MSKLESICALIRNDLYYNITENLNNYLIKLLSTLD